MAYLGAIPGQDVLLSHLDNASVSATSQDFCTVTIPTATNAMNNRDVMLEPAGDSWRRCLNEIDREVACSQPHVSEIFYESTGQEQELNCEEKADAYLEAQLENKLEYLRLKTSATECRLEVRGDNRLSASLRRLRSQALPIAAS